MQNSQFKDADYIHNPEKFYQNQDKFIKKYLNDDFFGHLKGKTQEIRKMQICEIYSFFYKFAQNKMRSFVDNPLIMLFVLQYLKDTKVDRIHTRTTLKNNSDAYYRSIENIINISQHSHICHKLMPIVLEHD